MVSNPLKNRRDAEEVLHRRLARNDFFDSTFPQRARPLLARERENLLLRRTPRDHLAHLRGDFDQFEDADAPRITAHAAMLASLPAHGLRLRTDAELLALPIGDRDRLRAVAADA